MLRGLAAPRPPQWLGHSAALHSHFLIAAQAASLLRHSFSALVFASQSPYPGRQTVAYSRNLMQNGVVQNAVQGTAVINGLQLTISGFPAAQNALNGNWTKQ
jgi:hypothetical protein